MLKVGITGQAGFVGTHLYNTLGLFPAKYSRIPFEDSYFQNREKLSAFLSSCDVIIHLAAVNRHGDPKYIYDTNISLVRQIIEVSESLNILPHFLFSSSTQEDRDNPYGRSKKKGRELFEKWSLNTGGRFTGLIIPNVFGPFGHPYYNSVVATFCHQLSHYEESGIDVDGELRLIHVSELVNFILDLLSTDIPDIEGLSSHVEVPHTAVIKVSELLEKIKRFRDQYFEKGMIPDLDNEFDRNLFNTFLTYIDHKSFYPFHLKQNEDERGTFVEILKLGSGGQVSFSTTKPGITRGNHFHTRKAERFAVIKGRAKIEIRKLGSSDKLVFELDGASPSFVDMPVWYTHNITNIGNEDVYTIFWINEHFNPLDPDTFFEVV